MIKLVLFKKISHNSSLEKRMNLTVCPPCGPGHDSPVE